MTLTLAIALMVTACAIVALMVWRIHTALDRAENRLRDVMTRALAEVDDSRLAATARARALDDEYRQLVLDAHNSND